MRSQNRTKVGGGSRFEVAESGCGLAGRLRIEVKAELSSIGRPTAAPNCRTRTKVGGVRFEVAESDQGRRVRGLRSRNRVAAWQATD